MSDEMGDDERQSWQNASGLVGDDGAGDPGDVTPKQLEEFVGVMGNVVERGIQMLRDPAQMPRFVEAVKAYMQRYDSDRRPIEMPTTEQELSDLRNESRRLRTILNAMAKGGAGVGALVEICDDRTSDGHYAINVVVCRADRDESAFLEDVRDALEKLGNVLGGRMDASKARRTGVTAGDPVQDVGGDDAAR